MLSRTPGRQRPSLNPEPCVCIITAFLWPTSSHKKIPVPAEGTPGCRVAKRKRDRRFGRLSGVSVIPDLASKRPNPGHIEEKTRSQAGLLAYGGGRRKG